MSGHLQEILKYRNAYALALSASMGSIFFGWDIGLIGGVLSMPSFQSYFGLDTKTASQRADLNGNIVSVLQAGCFFGALSTVYLSMRFGRRPSLLTSGVIYLIGSLIQCIVGLGSSQSNALSVLYFSRFLGWAHFRLVPGVLFITTMFFQPESPRWLVEHEKEEAAARSLAFVSRTSPEDDDVLRTIREIKASFAGQKDPPLLKQFLAMGESRVIALRCFIPSLVMFFQQWTGTNAINYFSPQIFASLGISGDTAGLFATGQ
ncbi:hypothetical protein C0993_000155 [Termitomyces sp. T159_Od127]|nr:hypothetical protein C0993_000155 [Termitomyces sp. T159_Od127]